MTTEIVFTWPDGREEVRYRRPADSEMAKIMKAEIDHARLEHSSMLIGDSKWPYSYRDVEDEA